MSRVIPSAPEPMDSHSVGGGPRPGTGILGAVRELPPGTPVDTTNCDREPIHLPGSIQPMGVLLCARASDGEVVQVSANASELFGGPVLGRTLADLLGAEAVAELVDRPADGPPGLAPRRLGTGSGVLAVEVEATTYSPDPTLLVVELERVEPATDAPESLPAAFRGVMLELQAARSVQDALDTAVAVLRRLTGFDRVWAYRFEPDEHGVIVAEDGEAHLASFLGLHYPAGDIPAQARALYLRNRVRVIGDVGAAPVPLMPLVNPVTGGWLDQSDGALRAVSPMHIQYLTTMGVTAAMSVAVSVEGRLWGLLSAHDYRGPRVVPPAVRTLCELASLVLAVRLSEFAAADHAHVLAGRESQHAAVVEQVAAATTVAEGIDAAGDALLAVCEADGALIRIGQELRLVGSTPDREGTAALLDWLDARPADRSEDVVVTSALGALDAGFAPIADVASGLLAVPLSRRQGNWIVWLRREYVRTVAWGARQPRYLPPADGPPELSPRASFELWRQSVEGMSRPWSDADVQSAVRLRATLGTHLITRAEELARLNSRLAQINEELDAFAYAAAHDLKEPLRGINVYARFLAEDYKDALDAPALERLDAILSLSTRMGSMLESLLDYAHLAGGELTVVPLDLPALVAAASDLVAARLEAAGGRIEVGDTGPAGAFSGDPDRMVDVLANLFANALKYRSAEPPVIRVGVTRVKHTGRGAEVAPGQPDTLAVCVADNGVGIAPAHQEEIFRVFTRLEADGPRADLTGSVGAGLGVCRRIVHRHGGIIWVESQPGAGSTFYFTLGP